MMEHELLVSVGHHVDNSKAFRQISGVREVLLTKKVKSAGHDVFVAFHRWEFS